MGTPPTGLCPLYAIKSLSLRTMCMFVKAQRRSLLDQKKHSNLKKKKQQNPSHLRLFHARLLDPDDVYITDTLDQVPPSYKELFTQADDSQDEIGWRNLRRGILSSKWIPLFDHHFKHQGLKYHIGEE